MTIDARTLTAMATALLIAAAGCGTGTGADNAGLTNGPPPAGSGEKAAMRTDMPDAVVPTQGETLGRTGDAQTAGGTAARGGGNEGAYPEQPKPDAADPGAVRANPPAIEAGSPNSAAGAVTPPERINTGTPRSPQ